ncbi:MAG TPA: hypothetical protein VGH54_21695 [Mycobacterium sp.]|jgi:hypothetical protein|uniref:hypothetical protein n=1 Tax=Mycobacterium sp. TaxID=1785 RepID=UPI002F3F1603
MRLGRLLLPFAAVIAAYLAYRYEHGLAHFLGIDTQASQNYDFASGVGPMLVTAVFSGGVIVSLWHGLNCAEHGCWRIGRHKVSGTPYCNRHHENARPERTELEVLESIERLLTAASQSSRTYRGGGGA